MNNAETIKLTPRDIEIAKLMKRRLMLTRVWRFSVYVCFCIGFAFTTIWAKADDAPHWLMVTGDIMFIAGMAALCQKVWPID